MTVCYVMRKLRYNCCKYQTLQLTYNIHKYILGKYSVNAPYYYYMSCFLFKRLKRQQVVYVVDKIQRQRTTRDYLPHIELIWLGTSLKHPDTRPNYVVFASSGREQVQLNFMTSALDSGKCTHLSTATLNGLCNQLRLLPPQIQCWQSTYLWTYFLFYNSVEFNTYFLLFTKTTLS